MKVGRELDALVAEEGIGLPKVEWNKETPCPYCGSEMHYLVARAWCSVCSEWRYGPHKEYSEDIAPAWEVHKVACGWIFSQRREYLHALQQVVSGRLSLESPHKLVAWPDVLVFLEPVDICLAALKAKGVEVGGGHNG